MDIRNFFGAPGSKKVAEKKKVKILNDNDDDDSDATTDGDEAEPPVVVKKSKPPVKKKADKEKRVDVDASAFFANAKPAAKRKDPSAPPKTAPKKKVKETISIIDDDDDDDDDDNDNMDEPTKKKAVVNLSDDSSDEEIESKRKTAAKKSGAKKRRVECDDDVELDFNEISKTTDDGEDDDFVEEEEDVPPKKKAKATPNKTPPKKKKAPAKKKTPVKKDPLLEPSLKRTSFDTDQAVPECLAGLTFVFSGILQNLGREDSIDHVKILGGRVTTAVSSKTSYLVVGELLEDGRNYTEGSKFKKASELTVQVVKGEEELYGLCQLYSDKAKAKSKLRVGDDGIVQQPLASVKEEPKSAAAAPSNPYAKTAGAAVKNPYAAAKKNPYAKSKPADAASSNPYAAPNKDPPPPASTDRNALWADKYAPTSTREILGNQESVRKLATWLNRWEHTFNNEKAYGKAFSAPNGPWRAALLSGPPGIGKTTTATLVAKEAERDVLEMNASDARSKKALTVGLGDVTGSQVIHFGAVGGANNKKQPAFQRRCLIMDEVDGMGAGDRSGMAELIKLIKNTKVPIICICNDRQSQKMRSLVPYCMDLRYKRPVKSVIARRAIRVGEQEGMRIEQNAAEAIAESCGNDIRQVLNCLQMWSSSKENGKSVTYKDLKKRESAINKDEILRVSMFDATKMIIEGRKGLAGADAKTVKNSLYRRSDAYFVDYSLMGLNVHQNYLKVMTRGYQEAVRDKDDKKMEALLDRMHSATMAMSDYAVAEQAVRGGDMNWSLLPFVSMMAVKTGYHGGGENGGFLAGFPEFAGWMGKNSSRGKKIRLLNELGYHMNYKVSTDKADLRLHYMPLLRERFMELLADGDKTKVTEAIELMDQYGLDRDDVFENMDEFKIDSKAKAFSDLDSKQKSAFTREYNKGIHKSQALVHEQGAGKVAKKSKGSKEKNPADLDAVDDDGVDDSEDDEDEELSEEKLKKLFGKKAAKKGKASGGEKATGKRKSK